MTSSAKIILFILLSFLSEVSVAESQKVYDVDPGRELTRVDSGSPSHYQSYGPYLFFQSLNNRINLPWSQQPAHINKAIWRLDTRDNSTIQIVNDFSHETDASNRSYQVLNDKIMYFAVGGFTIANLSGTEKSVLAELKDVLVMNEPNKLIQFNSFVYFSGRDSQTNKISLWRSNGTIAGTQEVPLCTADGCYESPRRMQSSGNKLFLISSAPNGQSKVWSIDNQNNTAVFTDAMPSSGDEEKLMPYLSGVQFNSENGFWFTDGTKQGSYQINYLTDQQPLIATEAINSGDNVIVAADELYVVKNHGKGTSTLIDIDPRIVGNFKYFSRPSSLTAFKNSIYFIASFYDDKSGLDTPKLMSFDGTSNVKELYTFEQADDYDYKIVGTKGNKLVLLRYAQNDDLTYSVANEIWISDGTTVGTVKISDAGIPNSFWKLNAWQFVNNDFYFSAFTETHGVELWRTDGTAEGTQLAKDLGYGIPRVQQGSMIGDGNSVFYQVEHKWYETEGPTTGDRRTVELWQTDAATMRSTKVSQWPEFNYIQPPQMIQVDNGQYWWVTNELNNGARDLRFFNKNSQAVTTVLSSVSDECVNYDWQHRVMLTVGDKYFFQGPVVAGENYSCQLWVSDGTTAGTKAITNFPNISMQPENIGSLALFNGEVYFSLNMVSEQHLDQRTAVYKTDGTPEGTKEVFRLSAAGEDKRYYINTLLATAHGLLIVSGYGDQHLWYWNSTALTQLQTLTDSSVAYDFVRFGQGIAYLSANSIYYSDGTVAGTAPLIALNQSPSDLVEWRNLTSTSDFQQLIYTAKDNNSQIRLWRSDGSAAGTFALGKVLDEYDFKLHAQVGNDLYISSFSTGTEQYSIEHLLRYSLSDTDAEVIYSQLVGDRNSPLKVVEAMGRVFIAGQLKLPGFGGPYVTARLDDGDMDQDGVLNKSDAVPLHTDEQLDHDADGLGNNADLDDDSDEVPDQLDAFPLNALEWADHDQDGIGNNADTDDDNDKVTDWQDSYPRDASRNNNTATGGTVTDPVKLPEPDPIESSESSGGAMHYFALWLLWCAALARKQRRHSFF